MADIMVDIEGEKNAWSLSKKTSERISKNYVRNMEYAVLVREVPPVNIQMSSC